MTDNRITGETIEESVDAQIERAISMLEDEDISEFVLFTLSDGMDGQANAIFGTEGSEGHRKYISVMLAYQVLIFARQYDMSVEQIIKDMGEAIAAAE